MYAHVLVFIDPVVSGALAAQQGRRSRADGLFQPPSERVRLGHSDLLRVRRPSQLIRKRGSFGLCPSHVGGTVVHAAAGGC